MQLVWTTCLPAGWEASIQASHSFLCHIDEWPPPSIITTLIQIYDCMAQSKHSAIILLDKRQCWHPWLIMSIRHQRWVYDGRHARGDKADSLQTVSKFVHIQWAYRAFYHNAIQRPRKDSLHDHQQIPSAKCTWLVALVLLSTRIDRDDSTLLIDSTLDGQALEWNDFSTSCRQCSGLILYKLNKSRALIYEHC